MKQLVRYALPALIMAWAVACNNPKTNDKPAPTSQAGIELYDSPNRFADLQILPYEVPGFDQLDLKTKKLVYYLYEAALCGRDIIYDQNYRHNIVVRRTVDAVVANYKGDKTSYDWQVFMRYAKRIWFSNGIHHHYSSKKFEPGFTPGYFADLVKATPQDALPLGQGQSVDELLNTLTPIMFDATVDPKRVVKGEGKDWVLESANNYYGTGVTRQEAEDFYAAMRQPGNDQEPLYGLNSKLVKSNGQLQEQVYKVGGMYGAAIEQMVAWLNKAIEVAENDAQKKALQLLVRYYETGNLKDFDDYNVAWVKDTSSVVDIVHGFIEVYGDAIGNKAAFESVLSIKDFESSEKMAAMAANAQWFEDNAPFMPAHKKDKVTGISYKVINVVVESGDAAPSTPIGINLPNSNWIRKVHGSKAVSLGNIKNAYANASSGGTLDEFVLREEDKQRAKQYGIFSGNMHTAMHEVLGHASGQLEPGVAEPSQTLKNYSSALEEARADLVSLYFLIDPKLVEIGVMPSLEVGKAQYDGYLRNGLMLQLRRIEAGENIEQAHMRNRQMVCNWVYEKGKADNVVEKVVQEGKTYIVVNDYEKLRGLFGELLREVQRIKSQGDYEAGKALIEGYGVVVDQDMLKEVKERYASLNSAPYSGFIQPKLVPTMEGDDIVDVTVEYPTDFVAQMLEYGQKYSFLPHEN